MTDFNFCLVSSEMLPLGERRVGVGGVTVISGGNLETLEEGMKSFGICGGTRDLFRAPSTLLVWTLVSEGGGGLELQAVSHWLELAKLVTASGCH